MNRTAYLVVWLDSTGGRFASPTVVAAGIYSEPFPTGTARAVPFPIHRDSAVDFAEAEQRVRNYIRTMASYHPVYRWIAGAVGATEK